MLKLPFVDEGFSHGADKTRIIEDFLTKNKKVFEEQLIGDLSHINHRAQNLNGIQIEDITYQSDNEYCMSYTYDWYVYNGCENMDEQGNEVGGVCFRIGANGEIEFDSLEFEERSTFNDI